MWRRSLRRPGFAGFADCSHSSRDCPPFQALVVKPRISTFTPQRTSEDVGAGRRDRDRPPPHRARIIEEERHDRVAEVRVLLLLEGERLEWIDDDPGEAR